MRPLKNEPTLDNRFNLSTRTKDPLPVINVSLLGDKKHIAITVAVLTCLWDSGATNSRIKRRHNKYYERKMRSKKGRIHYICRSVLHARVL